MPLKIIFPREGFTAIYRVFAAWLRTMIFLGSIMNIVDMAFEMCDDTKGKLAARTLVRSVMIAHVVTL